jgi:hypothetical protein
MTKTHRARLAWRALPTLVASLVATLLPVDANACAPRAARSDLDMQFFLEPTTGCLPEFFIAASKIYDIGRSDDSWHPWGYFRACDPSLPFAKTMSSIAVINYALVDDYERQWHSTEDYFSLTRSAASRFHSDYGTEWRNYGGAGAGATFEVTPFSDTVVHHCVMHEGGSLDSAATRAGSIVHEANHAWAAKRGYSRSHAQGPIGSCTSSSKSCDLYWWHPVSKYDFGDLHLSYFKLDGTPSVIHTAYQTEVEFLCDVAELTRDDIPSVVARQARNYANDLLATKFRNKVPYRCGDPRPF